MSYLSRLSDEELEAQLDELAQEIYDLELKVESLQIEEENLISEIYRRNMEG